MSERLTPYRMMDDRVLVDAIRMLEHELDRAEALQEPQASIARRHAIEALDAARAEQARRYTP